MVKIKINFKTRIVALLVIFLIGLIYPSTGQTNDSIRPYTDNPYYWQYKEEPVLLLGGTWQDYLFNFPVELEKHLDLLVENGENYVCNTMNHHNTDNAFPYVKTDGKYDLDQFNEEYWQCFDDFLRMTHERNIIVQIDHFGNSSKPAIERT